MGFFYLVFSFLIGTVVGSFVNVLVVRLPKKMSIIKPGSHCPQCQAAVRWYDNIPLLSYLILRGRCRSCSVKISPRYFLIELMTGVLFIACTAKHGFHPLLLVRDWPFMALLVAITFIDLEHRLIPDVLSIPGLVLGLFTAPLVGWPVFIDALMGAALGFGLFYGFAWLYLKMSGRSGLGGGDIKLLAMLGAFSGPHGVMSIILMSSILGSIFGIFIAVLGKKQNIMKLAIPFGPFLVLAAICVYFLGNQPWLLFMTQM